MGNLYLFEDIVNKLLKRRCACTGNTRVKNYIGSNKYKQLKHMFKAIAQTGTISGLITVKTVQVNTCKMAVKTLTYWYCLQRWI
jgi:hypothetical protein